MSVLKTLTQDRTVDADTAPYAIAGLRISLGVLLLAHSVYLKLTVFTLAGTAQYFESLGLPGLFAYAVFAAEAIAGLMLVVGYKVRLASLAVVPVLIGATWAHVGNGWLFSANGGGWEFPAFLVAAAIVQAGLGAGAFALGTAKVGRATEAVTA